MKSAGKGYEIWIWKKIIKMLLAVCVGQIEFLCVMLSYLQVFVYRNKNPNSTLILYFLSILNLKAFMLSAKWIKCP